MRAGLDTLMEDGVTFKYLSRLRRNWLAEMIEVPAPAN
jgi:hypothetical protein